MSLRGCAAETPKRAAAARGAMRVLLAFLLLLPLAIPAAEADAPTCERTVRFFIHPGYLLVSATCSDEQGVLAHVAFGAGRCEAALRGVSEDCAELLQ